MRTLGLLLAVGCAEPFAVQREVLGPFRIAAVGVVDGSAHAAVWSGQPFAEGATHLAWSLDGQPLGEGWGVPVPPEAAGSTLSLVATAPDGEQREAVVSVGVAPASFSVARQPVDLSSLWTLSDRLAAEPLGSDTDEVEPGLAVRLTADLAPEATARCMLPRGQGTLLALSDTQADLLPETLRIEDGELLSRSSVEPGLATALVLSLDGAGGNRWEWVQVSMGVPLGDRVRHEGFVVEADGADARTGLLAVTVADIDAEAGTLVLREAEAVEDLSSQESLACGPAPFRLAWLWEGRCLADEVLGSRIVLEVW